MRINAPASFGDYDVEAFGGAVPETLGAMESFTVPFRLTKRGAETAFLYGGGDLWACGKTAGPEVALFSEVRSFGGSCGSSANITAQGDYTPCGQPATKTASHTIIEPPSSSCTGATVITTTASGGAPTGGGGWGAGALPNLTGNLCEPCEPEGKIEGCLECVGGKTRKISGCQTCGELTDEYRDYAGKHQDDVYHTFAVSIACVAGNLCENSQNYNDPQWLSNMMNCLNDKWEKKETSCWAVAEKHCQRVEQTGLPLQPFEAGQRLACFASQIRCHWWDDYPECESKYGVGTEADRDKNWGSVWGCGWTFFKSWWD
jgi:hypothetical protein